MCFNILILFLILHILIFCVFKKALCVGLGTAGSFILYGRILTFSEYLPCVGLSWALETRG